MSRYTKAKKKFFRKRVSRYYFLYKARPLLCYGHGLFVPLADYNKYPIIRGLMGMSDTEAFWHCHYLEIIDPNYNLRYEKENNSITFQTEWKANFYNNA